MGSVKHFQLVDEEGIEHNASCEFFSTESLRLLEGAVGGAISKLPKCKLEDGRSIFPLGGGVFKFTEGGKLLNLKPDGD